jgi:hypothetical protein
MRGAPLFMCSCGHYAEAHRPVGGCVACECRMSTEEIEREEGERQAVWDAEEHNTSPGTYRPYWATGGWYRKWPTQDKLAHRHEWELYPWRPPTSEERRFVRTDSAHGLYEPPQQPVDMASCRTCGVAMRVDTVAQLPEALPIGERETEFVNSTDHNASHLLANYRVATAITAQNAVEVMHNARAARLIAEEMRDELLKRRTTLPASVNRPIAVLAENLAIAAWRIETGGFDDPGSSHWSELPNLTEKYNGSLDRLSDALRLVLQEAWPAIQARYGSVRRDAVPRGAHGCLGVLFLVAGIALGTAILSM